MKTKQLKVRASLVRVLLISAGILAVLFLTPVNSVL